MCVYGATNQPRERSYEINLTAFLWRLIKQVPLVVAYKQHIYKSLPGNYAPSVMSFKTSETTVGNIGFGPLDFRFF